MSESVLKLMIICATFVIIVALVLISTRNRTKFHFIAKTTYKSLSMETKLDAENSVPKKDSKKKKGASHKSTFPKNIKIH